MKFDTNPGGRPVDDSGDLRISDALEAAQHHHRSLQPRQLVVREKDYAQLIRNAFQTLPGDHLGWIGGAQEGVHSEFAQVLG
jgi:hypothetical protein